MTGTPYDHENLKILISLLHALSDAQPCLGWKCASSVTPICGPQRELLLRELLAEVFLWVGLDMQTPTYTSIAGNCKLMHMQVQL